MFLLFIIYYLHPFLQPHQIAYHLIRGVLTREVNELKLSTLTKLRAWTCILQEFDAWIWQVFRLKL
jgi:hypothetical protein